MPAKNAPSPVPEKKKLSAQVWEHVRNNAAAWVVAGIAFSGSFSHIVELCEKHGQRGWAANATAACVDLLCFMGAEERQRDKRINRQPKYGFTRWPTVVLLGGIVLTLAANLATASKGPWGKVVAAIPAVCLLVAVSIIERRANFDSGKTQTAGEVNSSREERRQPASGANIWVAGQRRASGSASLAEASGRGQRDGANEESGLAGQPEGPVAGASGRPMAKGGGGARPANVVAFASRADLKLSEVGAKMREEWDRQVAAGYLASGADLNEAAGKERGYSLGKKYAKEWRVKLPPAFIAAARAGRHDEAVAIASRSAGTPQAPAGQASP